MQVARRGCDESTLHLCVDSVQKCCYNAGPWSSAYCEYSDGPNMADSGALTTVCQPCPRSSAEHRYYRQCHTIELAYPADLAEMPLGPVVCIGDIAQGSLTSFPLSACAQHYAVKTIENLASRRGEWVDSLASADVAERLAAIWAGARTEALRSCAASALCRLARQSPGHLLPLLAPQRSILHLVRMLSISS